jgi:hypothetical protein
MTLLPVFILQSEVQIYLTQDFSSLTRRLKCAPCHHGMACPQVADGGDGLQLWRAAANILNTAEEGGPPAWELGMVLTTHRKQCCYEMSQKDGVVWTGLIWQMFLAQAMALITSLLKQRRGEMIEWHEVRMLTNYVYVCFNTVVTICTT